MDAPPASALAPGLWRWARRHPEWHPGEFGAEVVSFLAAGGEETLLVDPLLDGAGDPAWEQIETALAPGRSRLRVLITIPYHVRSAEAVRDRFGGRAEVTIHGHPACRKRLGSAAGFEPLVPGEPLGASGVTAHAIGKPRRFETPLHLPAQRALIFGDALAGTPTGPRMWSAEQPLDSRRERFYAERFAPTLRPLLDLGFDHLLLSHGPSVLGEGREALRKALAAPPWYHR